MVRVYVEVPKETEQDKVEQIRVLVKECGQKVTLVLSDHHLEIPR